MDNDVARSCVPLLLGVRARISPPLRAKTVLRVEGGCLTTRISNETRTFERLRSSRDGYKTTQGHITHPCACRILGMLTARVMIVGL